MKLATSRSALRPFTRQGHLHRRLDPYWPFTTGDGPAWRIARSRERAWARNGAMLDAACRLAAWQSREVCHHAAAPRLSSGACSSGTTRHRSDHGKIGLARRGARYCVSARARHSREANGRRRRSSTPVCEPSDSGPTGDVFGDGNPSVNDSDLIERALKAPSATDQCPLWVISGHLRCKRRVRFPWSCACASTTIRRSPRILGPVHDGNDH